MNSGTSLEISVVVPTFNRAESLERLLFALKAQRDAPAFEVLVINDGSTDDTAARVRETAASFPAPLRLVNLDHRGVAAARNAGLNAAGAELIAFLDDDCVPGPEWLGILLGRLAADPSLVAVGGRVPMRPEGRLILDYYNACGMSTQPMVENGEVIYLGGNSLYRKRALLEAGGFDEAQEPTSEDVAVSCALRARGGRLGFEPTAIVAHYHHPEFRHFLRTQFNYGRGEMIRLRFEPRPKKILRLLYRSRQFLLWLLLPLDWKKSWPREWTEKQKLLFPILERLRQNLLVLGQWREVKHALRSPRPGAGKTPAPAK